MKPLASSYFDAPIVPNAAFPKMPDFNAVFPVTGVPQFLMAILLRQTAQLILNPQVVVEFTPTKTGEYYIYLRHVHAEAQDGRARRQVSSSR